MNEKQWYDDQQIEMMLKHYSKGKYEVATSINNKYPPELINQMVSSSINEMKNKEIDTIVIPVNTANIIGSTHWTGLVLKKNDKGTVEAHYSDSFGSSMQSRFPELKQTLLNNDVKAENIYDYKVIQQKNGYDCGPWTVYNIDAIARGEKLYNPLSKKNVNPPPDIKGQREKLNEIMPVSDPHTRFQDIASKVATISAATRFEIEKIKKNISRKVKTIKNHLSGKTNSKKDQGRNR